MSSIETLNVPLLVEVRRLAFVEATVLADEVVVVAPRDLKPRQKRALEKVKETRDKCRSVRERRASAPVMGLKDAIDKARTAWGGFSDVIAAQVALSPEVGRGKEVLALEVQRVLFSSEGVPDLRLDAKTTFVEAMERLERIEQRDIEDKVVKVVGREQFEHVTKATRSLGDALGLGKTPNPIPSGAELRDALSELSEALSRYVLSLASDLDIEMPQSVARFRAAVAPIERQRLSQRGGHARDVEDEDETQEPAPTPDAPTPSEPMPSSDVVEPVD